MTIEGFRTYLVSAGIILHQVLMFAGIDVENKLISETIDAILALSAIGFRWMAAVKANKDVETALYTPVPTQGGK